MKQKALMLGALFIFLIGACAPQAAPTASSVDIQHTAEAAAFTMVAQTVEAVPTHTAVPPTETASPTPLPTLTLVPSPTVDPLLATATNMPGLPTSVSQSADSSTQDNCNKALTAWAGPTVNFSIVNETKPQGKITLSLYVVTELGECGYLADLSKGPVGQYSAGAFVDGKQSFKVFGGFRITTGNWKIAVRNDKIVAQGSCYPKC